MIDLASLTALRAVDDHGSVVAAAEALGFTPSAISQQVKRLERQTNVPLLERVGRGVMLTREGRHLVDAGSRLLADLETIESGLHQQAGTVAGHLRITAFSTAMRGLVAPRVRGSARRPPRPRAVPDRARAVGHRRAGGHRPGRRRGGAQLGRRDARDPRPPGDHLAGRRRGRRHRARRPPAREAPARDPPRPGRRGLDRHPGRHDLSRVALPDVPRHRPPAPDRPRVAGVPVAPGARRRRPGHRPGAPPRPRGAGRRPGRRTAPTTRCRPATSWPCTGAA